MEQSLEIIKRLWTEEKVVGDYPPYTMRGAVLYPKPVQKPHPPILIGGYVDAVLKRAATKGDGWLTYYYYTPESFRNEWRRSLPSPRKPGAILPSYSPPTSCRSALARAPRSKRR